MDQERKKELDEKFKDIEWIDVLERIADWDEDKIQSIKIYKKDGKFIFEQEFLYMGILCKSVHPIY